MRSNNFELQTNRIINLDESKVSTDGASSISGGCPVAKFSWVDADLPIGAIISNKRGYSVIFVGGSTILGWSVPAHLQVKSEVYIENIKYPLICIKI